MRFRFIEDRRADYPATILCDVLGVPPAGYYAWRSRPESERSAANRELVEDIRRVHRDTCGRYGSPRIHVELKAQGRGVSRGRIKRLMRHHGIRAIMARPRRVRTTDSRHDIPIAPNLLERSFIAAAPNRIWLADLTYVETDQGWLYLATETMEKLPPSKFGTPVAVGECSHDQSLDAAARAAQRGAGFKVVVAIASPSS
jgi:putative transposase